MAPSFLAAPMMQATERGVDEFFQKLLTDADKAALTMICPLPSRLKCGTLGRLPRSGAWIPALGVSDSSFSPCGRRWPSGARSDEG
ncbi:hypothetical protein BZR70_24335, partial [Salmonella enterica subsp. enterica serovar Enteritidis]|nr:hypothetical protein [Salmonella enterica subsp. enterica serovar Enteritidis]